MKRNKKSIYDHDHRKHINTAMFSTDSLLARISGVLTRYNIVSRLVCGLICTSLFIYTHLHVGVPNIVL